MDIEMPVMDGLEAARERRQQEKKQGWPAIPIIGVSGNASEKHRQAALAAGMNDYLTKPYGVKLLEGVIKQYTTPPTTPSKETSLHSDYWPLSPLLSTSIVTTPSVQTLALPDTLPRSLGVTPQTLDSKTQTATPTQPRPLIKSHSWDAHLGALSVSRSRSEPRTHNVQVTPLILIQEAEALLVNLIEQLYLTYPAHLKTYEMIRKSYLGLCANYYKRLEVITGRYVITSDDILAIKNLLKQLQQPASFSHGQSAPRMPDSLPTLAETRTARFPFASKGSSSASSSSSSLSTPTSTDVLDSGQQTKSSTFNSPN